MFRRIVLGPALVAACFLAAQAHAATATSNFTVTGNVIANYAFNPSRVTWMADYSPSEFSRIRLQLARDRAREGSTDNQLFLQYQMSLGAHGAHSY